MTHPRRQVAVLTTALALAILLPSLAHAGRSAASIRRTVRAQTDEIAACYRAALAEHPAIEGRLVLAFGIDDAGAVTDAVIARADFTAPRLERCVVDAARAWRFEPNRPGAGSTRVSYPFTFSRGRVVAAITPPGPPRGR